VTKKIALFKYKNRAYFAKTQFAPSSDFYCPFFKNYNIPAQINLKGLHSSQDIHCF